MPKPIVRDVDSVAYRLRARKRHYCGCHAAINPGDLYLSHVTFPGHDVIDPDAPKRRAQCVPCAVKYGHIEPEEEEGTR